MSIACVFPGQGSQSVGMLAALAAAYPEVEETFTVASRTLDYDLWQLTQQGPEAELNRTDKTQPAMLAAGVAVWRVWQKRQGAQPAFVAGHSLGEYTALVCAGSIDLESAVRLVAERGRYMQEAVPAGQGAMAAILGLGDEQVRAACDHAAQGEVVAAVNLNSPGQVVIAGHRAAVERAVEHAKQAGAKRALLLPVSVPSHCSLMGPAAERLALYLHDIEINVPRIPVLNNVDVNLCTAPEEIRDALVRQLVSPVRWVETIQALAGRGVRCIVECGPGKVLAGLNKRIDREMTAVSVQDPASLDEALTVGA
ncbi:MAG: ACP S-malonyltransferase [Gammaproteobacteria bacterium]